MRVDVAQLKEETTSVCAESHEYGQRLGGKERAMSSGGEMTEMSKDMKA